MSDEFWKTIGILIAAIGGSRWLSHYEHKKSTKTGEETNATVNEIKFYMNGEFEKRVEEMVQQRLVEEKKKWEQENKKL